MIGKLVMKKTWSVTDLCIIRADVASTTNNVFATMDELLSDDMALLRFGDRMIRQIMYGEETIALKGVHWSSTWLVVAIKSLYPMMV